MTTSKEQKKAAEGFVAYWAAQRGAETGEDQTFWKPLFAEGLTIDYAWTTFVWDSEAADKAHVHVVIVGFSVGSRVPRDRIPATTSVSLSNECGRAGRTPLPKLFHSDGTIAEAKRQAKREASGAPSNSVDDTTYSDEERWGHGEELPVARLGEDAAWDGEGLARLMVMADVRQVVGSLKGDSKRLCKWYLKTGSLRKAAEKMHEDSKYFFQVLWPRCKADFIAQWENLGKHFEGQR